MMAMMYVTAKTPAMQPKLIPAVMSKTWSLYIHNDASTKGVGRPYMVVRVPIISLPTGTRQFASFTRDCAIQR